MNPNERRSKILDRLARRRSDTILNLAAEFGVSERTIRYDIEILTLAHPIETVRGRYGGCVKLADGYYADRKHLRPEQRQLLEALSTKMDAASGAVLRSILTDFA